MSLSVNDALAAVPKNERLAALVVHLMADEEGAVEQIAASVWVLMRLAKMLPLKQRRAIALRLTAYAAELGARLN